MSTFLIIWLVASIIALAATIIMQAERRVVELVLILSLAAFATWVSLPNNPGLYIDINGDGVGEIDRDVEIRQGLDLAGGVQVLLETDLDEGQALPDGALDEARRIIESRIDALGALEPVVQVRGERRIIVELPGYEDPESAVELIQQTALLEFVDFGPAANSLPLLPGTPVETNFEGRPDSEIEDIAEEEPLVPAIEAETVFTGDIIQNADIGFDPTTNEPVVEFSLTPEGRQLFGDYTAANVGQPLGIVLDGILLSAPTISTAITEGQGVITGQFTVDDATQLATQLRYGSLPIPLRVDSTSTIGPTLGQISIEQSIVAGVIGIIVVMAFMLIYYRLPGLAATLALLIFAVINLAIYKLVPVTLTLPAITGFLISVGTAVDGNILIFERLKEELRAGKRIGPAVRAGFDRAWASIRDSNLSTIIICFVLWSFGTTFGAGAVRGFAVTLALGLAINLFTAVIVTRTFLHFLLLPVPEKTIDEQPWLFGLTKKAA
ncbi:MAG: protein translocase subunit SecD [Chloroflexi bacterium]|nr:protein translocase subunit SecD [Chloroflexota bacterium]